MAKMYGNVTLDAIQQLEKYGFHLYGDTEAGTPSASKPSISNKAQRRNSLCNT